MHWLRRNGLGTLLGGGVLGCGDRQVRAAAPCFSGAFGAGVCADVGNAVGNGIYPCGFGMCAADINVYGDCSLHNIGGCYGRNDPAYADHSRKAWGA